MEVDEPIGFREDLKDDHENAVRIRNDIFAEESLRQENRRVDIRRLLAVVGTKRDRSEKGRKFALFLLFTCLYVGTLFVQRAPYDSQTLRQTFGDHFTEAYFRDHATMEPKTFHDIVTVEDVWMWLTFVFLPRTFANSYDNGVERNASDSHTLLTSNRLTQGFRLVQRRARNHSAAFCIERPYYDEFAPNCYGKTFFESRIGDVDEEPFFSPDGKEKYEYREESSGLGSWLDQNVGYFQEFDFNYTDAQRQMETLQRNRWINPGTAWLRADFVFYNSNVNRFGFVKFTWEFKNSGQIMSNFQFRSIKSSQYETGDGAFRLGLEFLLVLFWTVISYWMVKEAIIDARASKHFFKHFNNLDALAELSQQMCFLGIMIVYLFILSYPFQASQVITSDKITSLDGKMINADSLSFLWEVYFIFNAVNLLISLFRMLSYVRINPNISQLTDTFAHCKDQIAQFAVVLALLLVTFTIMANLMFGAKVFEFSTFGEGFLSTVQIMIGNGDYFLIDKADKIAAPLFYYPFIMIMIFVVFNMTIAIIMDGYNLTVEKRKVALSENLSDLYNKSVFVQFWDGTLRLLAPIGSYLPLWLRLKKGPNGMEFDRYLAPDKYRTHAMMHALHGKAAETRYIPFEVYHMLVASSSSTELLVRETKFIIDRYSSWEDLTSQTSVDEESRARKERELTDVFVKMERLREKLETIKGVQMKMSATMDTMLRSWSIED